MNLIQASIQSVLPYKRKATSGGWISFNAPCCHHRGESKDTRKRGGIIFNKDGFVYHCFNCQFKAGWQPGKLLSKNSRQLMSWMGIPSDDILKLAHEALRSQNEGTMDELQLSFLLQDVPLPAQTKSIEKWAKDNCTDEEFIGAVEYILNRGLTPSDYPWHWSSAPGYRDRIIIPFYNNGKIVGWTGRKINSGIPKYLTTSQAGYVFNIDAQGFDRKFVIVCEGQFDAISVDGVAIMTNEPSETQIARIKMLDKTVIVVPDRDKPGAKLIGAALNNNWNVSMPPWDDDIKDISDAVKRYGKLYTISTILHYQVSNKIRIALMKRHLEKNKIMPETTIVNASCKTNFVPVSLPHENYEWLLEEFELFSRHKALERAIIKSSDLLEEGDYGPVEKMIKDAVQISLNRDMGTDYFEDPKSRLLKLKDNNGQVSTGWPTIDKKLYGGFKRGELNIFCAGSGGGKSLFLANLGLNFALAGLNVIYFTFELSEELVGMRLDSMLTGIASKEIFRHIDDVELKVRTTGKKSGLIKIKYLPSGKNCNDLRSYLKHFQVKTGKKPDIILVDYLDLMMPLSVKVNPSDLFVKDKYVSEELRNLAMETQAVVVTASQLNRSAVEEIEFDHSHISGGLSKIQTADNVFGIFTSRAMRERGRYQVQFMKTRSSSGIGQKVDLEFNVDTLRINDLEEEPQETSFAQQKQTPANALMQGLKRTSTVKEDVDQETGEIRSDNPAQGIPVPKVKAVVGSSRMREMLTKLNSEKD